MCTWVDFDACKFQGLSGLCMRKIEDGGDVQEHDCQHDCGING